MDVTTSSSRATVSDGDAPFSVGDWRVEPAMRRATHCEAIVKIDPRNMRVLQLLADRAGQVVSAREIEMHAWAGIVVTADSVYQSIRQLRRALGDTKSPATYIETVPRRGYRLVCAVATLAAEVTDASTSSALDHHSGPRRPAWREPRSVASAIAVIASCVALIVGIQFERTPEGTMAVASARPSNSSLVARPTDFNAASMKVASAGLLRELGGFALARGNPQRALRYFERALQAQSKVDPDNEMVAQILVELARTHFWMDNHSAAIDAGTKAQAILERATPESQPERILTYSVLGEVLIGTGEYARADELIAKALALARQLYGESHIALLEPLGMQATLRLAQGRLAEAESIGRATLKIAQQTRGPREGKTAYWHSALAWILVDSGKYEEAIDEARTSLEILLGSVGPHHPYVTSAQHILAEGLAKMGALDEAERLLRAELDALKSSGAAPWRIARATSVMGEVLSRQGRLADAESHLVSAQAVFEHARGWPNDRERRWTLWRMAKLAALQSPRLPKLALGASASE